MNEWYVSIHKQLLLVCHATHNSLPLYSQLSVTRYSPNYGMRALFNLYVRRYLPDLMLSVPFFHVEITISNVISTNIKKLKS